MAMSISVHNPYDEPEQSSTTKWIVAFVLLSLLAHAILIAVILLITLFMPVPKLPAVEPPSTTLTLTPIPPEAAPQPKMKPIFIPTTPEANAPHKPQRVESANDHDLTSKSTVARAPNSIMPDVTGKDHATSLNNLPSVQTPQKQEVSSTPPTPKAQPEKPTPPTPNPNQARQTPQQPPQPNPKPQPPTPPTKTTQPVDDNGLPLLPALNVPTMAPPNSAAPALAPSATPPQIAQSVHGTLGRQGDNSPAAMATELGRYKQYVYSVVGSYWYPAIDKQFGLIGVGAVHIQFTIHSNGQITDVTVLDGNTANLEILRTISHNALVKPAPYKAFSDAMIKEVGDSYTDDFSFSVY